MSQEGKRARSACCYLATNHMCVCVCERERACTSMLFGKCWVGVEYDRIYEYIYLLYNVGVRGRDVSGYVDT